MKIIEAMEILENEKIKFDNECYLVALKTLISACKEYKHILFQIGEGLVDESKGFILPEKLVDKIREELKEHQFSMDKIQREEYDEEKLEGANLELILQSTISALKESFEKWKKLSTKTLYNQYFITSEGELGFSLNEEYQKRNMDTIRQCEADIQYYMNEIAWLKKKIKEKEEK